MTRQEEAESAVHGGPVRELAALRDVAVPPALVARVMTKVAEPRPASLWQMLRRPIRVEFRVSPFGGLALALGLTAALALLLSPRAPAPPTIVLSSPDVPSPVLVRFSLDARGAKQVSLVGSFNDWNTDTVKLEDRDREGHFVATVALRPGLHEYMFLVDGVWVTDPTVSERRPDGFGRQNALLRL